ncbi:peptidoglycan DD-metalloendopeptidase family protein [Ferrimonas lipolytica]|uniref:Peptidoglycan DD-metalloendopeptidase family protein n=1 Tax=Ferrimonas lipolytica TaxID=2724191 RepID=A0A6H1UDU1_9GAMM|nr:peptidoglycan DD-metalloendopeptidase family protein [Ferrimonas lipolytica]QIZ76386.1 peptidoglycan DD-metalloendopeptidase family protein [Ferrimonas lipolytica]
MLFNWLKTRRERAIFSGPKRRFRPQARRHSYGASRRSKLLCLLPTTPAAQKTMLCLLVLVGLGYLFSQQQTAPLSNNQRQSLPALDFSKRSDVTAVSSSTPVLVNNSISSTAPVASSVTGNPLAERTIDAAPTPAVTTDEQVQAPEPSIFSPQVEYQIQKGDTLSGIFDRFAVGQQQMYQLLEADYALLALDTLMPGNLIKLWIDADSTLTKFEIEFDRSHQVVFTRAAEGYEVNEVIVEGDWLAKSIEVSIEGSFSGSAQKAGLSSALNQQIYNMFKDKLDFRRALRAGDTVRVLKQQQSIDGELTGNERLLAIEFEGRNWQHTAYLHDDGSYYDAEGQSLARAFLRHPFANDQRLSSRFNPRRLHPVTKRVSPHNGTDYAAPYGTAILAAGDGVVKRVENHPIAGKYVVIQHGGEYRTRYLHMSRIDVRRGQTVSRGQRIGAVGKTGRVTGTHLHYEFHIRGRAVDSLRAKIPMATSVNSDEKQQFLAKVNRYRTQMNEMLARQQGGTSELASTN